MKLLLSRAQRAFFNLCEEIECGTLIVRTPSGEAFSFGEGAPRADLYISDWGMLSAISKRGEVGLGESYVQGMWDSTNVEALFLLLMKNGSISRSHSRGKWFELLKSRLIDRLLRYNTRRGSSKNIKSHYDVGNAFYRLWLDKSMTYSSALYADSSVKELAPAQQAKYARLDNLLPQSANHVLEIGCGWGGYAQHATEKGRQVTGVTLSPSQMAYCQDRLGADANIRLQDYRDVQEKYDSIVSIEMVEAVGMAQWGIYFSKVKASLHAGGRAALQAIIVEDDYFNRYKTQTDFVRQYTFPGGMLIPPSQIKECSERAGLQVSELFRFGEDYAQTLREWLKRFNQAEASILELGYNESFLRSWRYYLQFCAAGFSDAKQINVVQFTLQHV